MSMPTSKVQEAPAARLPAVIESLWLSIVKTSRTIEDPAPQKSLAGSVALTGNGRKAVNSSVNATFVAGPVVSVLVTMNRSVTFPPEATGSSVNSLVSNGAGEMTRLSFATFFVTGLPPIMAVAALVEFMYVPGTAFAGT